tara:strand:+ start:729 stop:1376 length:648 start_codon:yes stop_codon:yes gene_type:complete
MATPNVVPRANCEGNLGTSLKKWVKMYTCEGFQIGADNAAGTFQMSNVNNGSLIWEGSGADAHEMVLTSVNPTADILYSLANNTAGNYYLAHTASSHGTVTETFIICASDETTAITTGDDKVKFAMPYAFTLTKIKAHLSTASSSGNVLVQVTEAGAGNNITSGDIALNTGTAYATTSLADASLAADAVIGINIDGAGTGAKGLKVTLIGYQTNP